MKITEFNYDHLVSFLDNLKNQVHNLTDYESIMVYVELDKDDYLLRFQGTELAFGWYVTDMDMNVASEREMSLKELFEDLEIVKAS